MEITGGCFCKALRYSASLEPDRVGLCHCRDCQIFSGSAFRMSGFVAPSNFHITKGEPRYFDKVADSGKVRRMVFCDQCGTHLCSMPSEDEMDTGFVSVRVANCDQIEQFKPRAEIFCSSRMSWMPSVDGALEFERMFD